MSTPIIQFPWGIMDSDSDFQTIRNKNYPHGKNISFDTESGESQWDAENILGNLYAARLGEVIAQDKIWRVYLNTTDATTVWEIVFRDQNNVALFSISSDVATFPLMAGMFADLDTKFQAAMPADWSGVFNYLTTSATAGYVDISLSRSPYLGHEWYLSASDTVNSRNADTVILAEAIDQSLTGFYRANGSYDYLGNLFVWATTGIHMPREVVVLSIAANGFGEIRVTTQTPHLLVAGDSGGSVIISGTGSAADGVWLFVYVTGTTIDLVGSVYSAPLVTTGIMTIWKDAYGTVASVVPHNLTHDSWTLKKLIRTKELPFRLDKQIEAWVTHGPEFNRTNFYWTDNNINPKTMVYYGTFIDDGAIDALNPETVAGDDGHYSYGTIAEETRLMRNNSRARLEWTDTIENGGAVKSGNWMWAFKLVTDNFQSTLLQAPTNPVNIYSADGDAANNKLIIGDAAGVSTPKRVLLTLTNLDKGLFKYVELIGINVIGPESVTVWNIKRVEITGETMTIEHTGLEPGAFVIDPTTLLFEAGLIEKARHLRALDNYLLLGDITEAEEIDLTPMTTQIRHTLRKREMAMGGAYSNLGPAAEFMTNFNVYNRVSRMVNETYREGIVFKYRNGGGETKAYPVDDIKVDCLNTNTVSSAFSTYGDRRGFLITNITYAGGGPVTVTVTTSARHSLSIGDSVTILDDVSVTPAAQINTTHTVVAIVDLYTFTVSVAGPLAGTYVPNEARVGGGLPNADLTNDAADLLNDGRVYSFFIEFHNILWDYVLPNGQRVRDVFESFRFVRQECIPEVLGTGMFIPSQDLTGTYFPQSLSVQGAVVGPPAQMGQYTPALNNIQRQLAFFVCPDILLDLNRWAYQTGDDILLYGYATPVYEEQFVVGINYNLYVEFNGFFQPTLKTAPTVLDIEAATNISMGDSGTIDVPAMGGTINFSTSATVAVAPFDTVKWDSNMVIGVTQYFQQVLNDSGIYYGQYFRLKANKYGAITEGFYLPTGHYFKPADDSPSLIDNQEVFGGDVFTQKTYHHFSYREDVNRDWCWAFSFYSQNRANSQMRNWSQNDTGLLFPSHANSAGDWVNQFWTVARDQFRYNKGYSIFQIVDRRTAYDADDITETHYPTDIIWSQVKLVNSRTDSWTNFLPLDRVSLDRSKGDLMGMHILNGELYTRQQRDFSRQFFNSRGMLQTADSEAIILGTGNVMSRPGQTTSIIGSSQKWAFVQGRSQGGNDTLYWVNIEFGKFLRFGADGTLSIADIKGLRAFFANSIIHATGDRPAAGAGIHGVWFDRRSEAIFNLMGVADSEEWTSGATYEVGDIVHLLTQPAGTYTDFGQTGEIYVAIQAGAANADNMPESGINWEDNWEKIAHTDTRYYSQYTLIYSEVKNGFICYASFKPPIFFQIGRNYMSPHPTRFEAEAIHAQDEIFIHNKGVECEWYRTGPYHMPTGVNYITGSLTVTSASGMLTSFPQPDVFTYSIIIDDVKFYIKSVTSDTEAVLQSINDDDGEPIVPGSSGSTSNYYISLAEDGEISMIVNDTPNLSKVWEYLQMNTYRRPWKVLLDTPEQTSYLNEGDFEYFENYFYGQVQSDTTNNPTDNTVDTTELYGPWLKITLKFRRFVYQNIKNLIVTIEENLPNPLK